MRPLQTLSHRLLPQVGRVEVAFHRGQQPDLVQPRHDDPHGPGQRDDGNDLALEAMPAPSAAQVHGHERERRAEEKPTPEFLLAR